MNCINKPEFTKEQIAECKECKWASAKIRWCGKWRCWIGEQQPGIIVPNQKIKYPSLPRMAGSFAKAAGKQMLAGNPKRSEAEIKRIMAICNACDYYVSDAQRCMKCGCSMKKKIPWQTTKCLINKWR